MQIITYIATHASYDKKFRYKIVNVERGTGFQNYFEEI